MQSIELNEVLSNPNEILNQKIELIINEFGNDDTSSESRSISACGKATPYIEMELPEVNIRRALVCCKQVLEGKLAYRTVIKGFAFEALIKDGDHIRLTNIILTEVRDYAIEKVAYGINGEQINDNEVILYLYLLESYEKALIGSSLDRDRV